MKRLIIHIVPSLDIGGVEVGIIRSHKSINDTLDYRVYYVRRPGTLQCGQRPIWRLFFEILFGSLRPDFVVTSLWWSHIFGRLLRIFGISWIAFFHNAGFSHYIDRVILRWAWRHADHCFVDSVATERAMDSRSTQRAFVVPYIFQSAIEITPWGQKTVDFVWIGRTSSVKRIDLLVEFLKRLEHYDHDATVVLIIAGLIPNILYQYINIARIKVSVYQNLPNDEVLKFLSKAKFFLLFSDHEGMSMSTIEAVQSGCVPVVRRVGEISSYLDDQSCISIADGSIDSINRAAETVVELASDTNSIDRIISRANYSVRNISHYIPSFISAISSIDES